MKSEFEKFAVSRGISSATLHSLASVYAGYINPTIVEERKLNVAQMDVFSRLMVDRIIFLGCPIDDDVANIIHAQLLFLDSNCSPGGVVYAGLGIYDTMQTIRSDVKTICTGMAASMASVLLAAGAKGKRSILPHSRVMIHQPMGGAQGQASDIEITAREIVKLKGELHQILAHHTGKPVKEIARDADRDFWMTAPEALAYGMVDEIIAPRK